MSTYRAARLVFAALAGAILLSGCAARTQAPRELLATPAGEGHVRLVWAPDPRADGYVVERRTAEGDWRQVARPATAELVDEVRTGRRRATYRVAALAGDARSDWALAEAVPGFVGKPLHGWLVATEHDTCRIPRVGPRDGLQCALEQLGGRTGPDADPTVGPHVLWIPAGTYRVQRTLWLEGRAGVQVVGEAGQTVLRWAGPRGDGPAAPRVMFHAEGNRDTTWRGLIWDGGCADPTTCWVVAFDQSFCGRSDLPILRSSTCGEDVLGWPERPTIGESDNGSAHFDSMFRNAFVGLRIGHHGVADDTATHRRVAFEDNFVGVSLDDFNALRHWFWDPSFERNFVGITNNTPDVLHTHDAAYAPGRCRTGAGSCYSNADCGGTTCEWQRRWAGDYTILRGRFRDNGWVDIWAEPTGEFVVRDAVSVGSQRFFFAGGPNATPSRFSLIGNRVRTAGGPAVRGRTPGPFLLVDNVFAVEGPSLGRFDSMTGMSGQPADVGRVDLLSAGNAWSAGEAWSFAGPARTLDSGSREMAPLPFELPARPIVVDPLDTRPIYTVVGANGTDAAQNALRIQAVIDAAARDPRPAVVHLPGIDGRYLVSRPLSIPASSDLTIVGDGAWTTLQWTGPRDTPMIEIDAGAIRGLTLRDLQLRHGGLVVRGVAEPGATVLLSQVRVAEAGTAAVVVDGALGVDVADLQANGGLLAGGAAIGVAIRDSVVRLWSGITLRNAWDFDVVHAVAGASVLLENNYMENSLRHLRVRGAASGEVVVHGAKVAPVVPEAGDLDDLEEATTVIDVGSGSLDLVQSQLFVIPPAGGGSSQAAVDRGARVHADGPATSVRAVGVTVRTEPEYRVTGGAAFMRIGGKQASPAALPLPDVRAGVFGTEPLEEREAREVLDAATRRLAEAQLPPFYDEAGAEDAFRVRLDKVFVFKAPGVGVHLVATAPCRADRDCADAGARCNRDGLDEALPGRCE